MSRERIPSYDVIHVDYDRSEHELARGVTAARARAIARTKARELGNIGRMFLPGSETPAGAVLIVPAAGLCPVSRAPEAGCQCRLHAEGACGVVVG